MPVIVIQVQKFYSGILQGTQKLAHRVLIACAAAGP